MKQSRNDETASVASLLETAASLSAYLDAPRSDCASHRSSRETQREEPFGALRRAPLAQDRQRGALRRAALAQDPEPVEGRTLAFRVREALTADVSAVVAFPGLPRRSRHPRCSSRRRSAGAMADKRNDRRSILDIGFWILDSNPGIWNQTSIPLKTYCNIPPCR